VQFVFLFSLLAGGIVLYSALLTAFDERRYELAVMRALGAVVGQVLAENVFLLDMPLSPWLFPLATLAGVALSVGVGWLAVRQLLGTPPLLALRAGA
jgi:putative ABC transport system permease protein